MDLKPCPFCGENLFLRTLYNTFDDGSFFAQVRCSNCNCKGPTQNAYNTCKEAIADAKSEWNNRASGWISVDDELPETEQICDVWLSCSDGSKGRLSNVIWNGKDWIDAFFNRTKIHEEQWITHWIAAPSEPEVKHG